MARVFYCSLCGAGKWGRVRCSNCGAPASATAEAERVADDWRVMTALAWLTNPAREWYAADAVTAADVARYLGVSYEIVRRSLRGLPDSYPSVRVYSNGSRIRYYWIS